MGLILLRYGELALKSRPVRLRFERTLMRNIEQQFLGKAQECLLSREWGRIMAHVRDDGEAVQILGRIFGITSFSPAIECSSEAEEVARLAAERSLGLVRPGQSFAIRARRVGTHPYTSQQLASRAGAAVLAANEGRGLRVDLSAPDAELFIEVRGKRAYLFAERFPGPGGLPMGTQGRVAALLEDERSAAAAWLMMKRGCWVVAAGEGGGADRALAMLRPWAPALALHPLPGPSGSALERLAAFATRRRCEALVLGSAYAELEKGIPVAGMPVLFPLCGMSEPAVTAAVMRVRAG